MSWFGLCLQCWAELCGFRLCFGPHWGCGKAWLGSGWESVDGLWRQRWVEGQGRAGGLGLWLGRRRRLGRGAALVWVLVSECLLGVADVDAPVVEVGQRVVVVAGPVDVAAGRGRPMGLHGRGTDPLDEEGDVCAHVYVCAGRLGRLC